MNFMLYDDGCGRYTLSVKPKDLQKRYGLDKTPKDLPTSYDVRPGQTMPGIITDEHGKPTLEPMKWGLIPNWWEKDEKIGYRTFNARDDKVFSSNFWRGIYKQRVLIPATGYFEWTKTSPKHKYFFRPKGLEIFSFAGIYEIWQNGLVTYTLITTEPNKEAGKVHDRMPVILKPEDEASWLEPSRVKREDIEPLLHPLEDNGLEVVEVASDVNALEYNDSHRIAALKTQ